MLFIVDYSLHQQEHCVSPWPTIASLPTLFQDVKWHIRYLEILYNAPRFSWSVRAREVYARTINYLYNDVVTLRHHQ